MKQLVCICMLCISWQWASGQLILEPYANGFTEPVDIAHAGDSSGRLFVVEQPGRIRIIDESGTILDHTFLDITNQVDDGGGEEGLLGLAFHPQFSQNGFFFVYYTRNNGQNESLIERYAVDATQPNQADPSSAVEVFTMHQPQSNHNGGDLNFGPEGNLYIGIGDGGSANDPGERSQDLTLPLGKLLRINVDELPYSIPPDNPYALASGDTLPEIWASGLRNPWRFSFDDQFNLWIGDVGQSDREEINYVPAEENVPGLNYGWDCREGNIACPRCNNPQCEGQEFVEPAHWYGPGPGLSVTGGYVLEGPHYPLTSGTYIFADFALNEVRTLNATNGSSVTLGKSGATRNISTFGEDETGRVYAASHDGTIYLVRETALQTTELMAVQVSHFNKTVLLEWETDPDADISHFEVERRRQDGSFLQIGVVPAKSFTQGVKQYQFLDETRYAGKYEYRLKTVGNTGDLTYSFLLSVEIGQVELVVTPNPAKSQVHVEIPEGIEEGLLQVIGLNGSILHSQHHTQIGDEPIAMDISNLDRGLVLVQFTSNGNHLSRKLMLYH